MPTIALVELQRFYDFVGRHAPLALASLPKPSWPRVDGAAFADAQVPDRLVFDAFAAAMRATDDPALPIRFGGETRAANLGVYGFVLQTASTVEDALHQMLRFQALVSTSGRLEVERRKETARLVWKRAGHRSLGLRVANEAVLAEVAVIARQLGVGQLSRVTFRHPKPRDDSAHRQFFAAPLEWSARADALEWPAATLTRRLPMADPAMAQFFAAEAARRLADRPREADLLGRARAELELRLASDELSLGSLAEALGVSHAELRRAVREERLTWRALVDEVRRARAKTEAAAGKSMTEIAFLLGFSELSAMSRAWKRWFGAPARKTRRSRPSSSG